MQVLNRASGFVRSLIAKRINLRVTPEIKFILDDSLEYSLRLIRLLEKLTISRGFVCMKIPLNRI